MSAGRIRVLIAGNIYVKRALGRRFLEDDGYEVVAEAFARSDIRPGTGRSSPDAIVVEDELLEEGTIARIRESAPDAKIVVFTSTPPGASGAVVGADAYLEKGVALAGLTALLGRLVEPVRAPGAETELHDASLALDQLVAAIEGGNYVLATVEAQALMDAREVAFAAGFTTSGLDAEVTARLTAGVVDIPAGAATNLQAIVGDLYPVLQDESEPGGGSDVVLGGTESSDDGGSTAGSGDPTTGGGADGGGGGGGGREKEEAGGRGAPPAVGA